MSFDDLASALADRYRVERELGQGGMATVYLAEDLRHHRQVAIKVLKPELAAVIGAERFLREIQTVAALQHPHILGLFDSGVAEVERSRGQGVEPSTASTSSTSSTSSSASSLVYYVMPFVEGESLRDRLTREKQLPIADAVRIASEVASALDYAHRHGVIHRDIKPENILLHDGSALVADFGIALAVSNTAGHRMTETGMSLGTPHYMSPEQAMGERDLDARADVYALGCVLYEMLTGEPPFTGPTAQVIVAKVMTATPEPVTTYRKTVSPAIEDAVLTALQKLPADRFASARDFAAALTSLRGGAEPPRRRAASWRMWSVAGIILAALSLGAAAGRLLDRPAPASAPAPVRFVLLPDSGNALGRFSIAPDGSAIAFWMIRPDSSTELLLRPLDALDARPIADLPHQAGASTWRDLFFSPDGKWIGFIADGVIEKVPVSGGTPVVVARVPAGSSSAAWAEDGSIFYADGEGAILRLPADGTQPKRVLAPQGFLRFTEPRTLPGGRGLLVSVASAVTDQVRWAVLSLATGQIGELHPGAGATYVDAGLVISGDVRGNLLGQRFNLKRLAPEGEPHTLQGSVAWNPAQGGPAFAVSRNGTLILTPGRSSTLHLMLTDRTGKGRLLPVPSYVWGPRFSPDGRRLAFGASAASFDAADLWVLDLAAGTTQRITSDSVDNNDPAWSPDGRSLVYDSKRGSSPKDLYVQPADGSGDARPLFRRPGVQWSSDWSPDGRWILFTNVSPDGANDIWMVAAAGDTARPWAATPFSERGARFSPDGHWVAYSSNETGRWEVYIQSFPEPGAKIAVSAAGGYNAVWRRDGRELYYWTGDHLMAARLSWEANRPRVTGRERLFDLPYARSPHPNYDITPDGRQFVFVVGDRTEDQIIVTLNAVGAAP